MNDLVTTRVVSDLIEECRLKMSGADDAVSAYENAKSALDMAGCVGGTFVEPILRGNAYVHASDMRKNLLKSGWKAIYNLLSIPAIAPAKDCERFERELQDPPELTLDNVRATFGDYLLNPREHILRGLAEAFCELDPAYKSHSKVKIGVKGLPKRVIINSASSRYGYGSKRLTNMINALQTLRGLPHVTYRQMDRDVWGKDIKCGDNEVPEPRLRGLRFKLFQNGNVHVFFDHDTCMEINRGLAEYYGDILPDVEPGEDAKPSAGRAVSKDLQFYPTPDHVAESVVSGIYIRPGQRVLEPSCGDGALMHHVPTSAQLFGYEYHAGRAAKARGVGYNVVTANFLEVSPTGDFDHVVMNPPFYGKHYLKHINHAIRFLKQDGFLTAILPASAWYDHKKLPDGGSWRDLPVGSFAASGTRVPTGVWSYRRGSA